MTLSTDEFIRYQHQINLNYVGYSGQKKLKSARVLIIGMGGLGCPVSLYLLSSGVGALGLVDHDKVDISNLHRQILYTEDNIGQLKVEVAKNKLCKHNYFCDIKAFSEKLDNNNSSSIFKNYDIIADCTDNFATRYLISEHAKKLNKTLISAAIDNDKGQVCIFPKGANSCYACLFEDIDSSKLKNCSQAGVLGTTAGLIGTLQAQHIIHAILNPLSSSYLVQIDTSQFSFKKFSIPSNLQCVVCNT